MKTKKRPVSTPSPKETKRAGNYPAGDLPALSDEELSRLVSMGRIPLNDFDKIIAERDRAHRKVSIVQDWPDHKERTHSAMATVGTALQALDKSVEEKRRQKSRQPALQKARTAKQSEDAAEVRKAYRKLGADIVYSSVARIPKKLLVPEVMKQARKEGLPFHPESVVVKWLEKLTEEEDL